MSSFVELGIIVPIVAAGVFALIFVSGSHFYERLESKFGQTVTGLIVVGIFTLIMEGASWFLSRL